MRVPRVVVLLFIMALGCLGGAPPAAASPDPLIVVDAPLRPLAEPPVAELSAYTCTAAVTCEDEQCVVRTTQRYHLSLPEGAAAHTLRVGLPAQALGLPVSPSDIALLDEQGSALPIVSHDAEYQAVWEVPLERGRRRVLELSYSHPTTTDPFIIWTWEAAALSVWGTVPAVHGEFVLPVPAHDDALVRVDPHRANLLGERLWWDYEAAAEYPPHHVVVIAPPVWEQLLAARARGAHRQVAATLADLQAAARAEAIPGIDYAAEVIAELLAALEANPGDTDARIDLAEVYRSRAEDAPEGRLNYLLLAARELSLALEGDGPRAEELSTALGRTYLEAAEAASASGDPAGALEYLGLAREVAGTRLADELAHADELTLHWALKLAEQGRVSDALAQLDGLLAPALHDSLLHFAPPLVAARTEVSLRPSERTVRYRLEAYPPAAPRVRERLDDLVQRLHEVPCCEVGLDGDGVSLVLTVRAPGEPAALEACRRDVHATLAAEQDMVAAVVAAPWLAAPSAFSREPELWHERVRYAERIDTTALDATWRSESEYAGWRLVELHSAAPADSRAQLEQQLALSVMRDQRQVWEALPSASQWIYDVGFADPETPSAAWLVAWGQDRTLTLDRAIPHWGDIQVTALAMAALLAVPLIARRLWRTLCSRPQ